jgi:hypothetical protein
MESKAIQLTYKLTQNELNVKKARGKRGQRPGFLGFPNYRGRGGEFEGRAGESISPGPPLKFLILYARP